MSSNTAKFVPKFKRKKAKRDKDEFFVNNKNDISIVKKYKDKIERMYPVQIQLDAKCEGGQWILVFGEHVDKRNAKNYIQAICNPGERKVVEFPQSALKELTDPQTLEYIEAKTNAFIRPLEKIAEFEISGTELAVTLALSEIEELAGSAVKERSGEVTDEQTDGGVIEISPLKGNTKKRLSDQLQRALSNHSDGICSVDDYKETSAAVQRVLVNCLEDEDNDIDDDDLFSDGKDGGKDFSQTFQVKIYDDEPDSSESFKTCDEYDIKPTTDVLEISRKLGSTSLSKSQKSETPDIKPTTDVLEISRKLGSTSLSKSQKSETPDTAKADQALNEQQEYLRSFGLNLGFNDQDVNHALNMIDEKTRPSDFFDLLNIVKQQTGNDSTVADNTKHELDTSGDDVIIEGETIEYFTKEKSTEEVSNTVKGASAADSSKSEQTTLPETYKERLMMDFFQEDDTCDIEELKRRNAERQKLLKLNFEKQGQAENQIESKGKKKRRGKQKKNKQQSSSGECAPMAVCENSTFSNDMEQTCRLRIWSDDDSGKITGENNASELDEFRTPNNRKNRSQSAGNQQQEQQMSLQYGKGRGQNPQGWHSSQNTPNKPTQRGNSYSEVAQGNKRYGSPGRAQFGSPGKGQRQYQKPMQVVNPVNVVGQARVEAPQGVVKPAELRYIVIDGSNVAMTHGNGKEFSCKGIQVCVDYFKQRGHQKITVFVPNWRNCHPSPENMIVDQHILKELKEDGTMVFTPSRRIGRKLVAAYDDRFVVELAEAEDAIIVSNDQYRDLMTEKATWKTIIETRLLMYSFVRDRFMPPNDPLGRDGPCLDQFLTVTQDTPRHFHGFYQPRQNYKQYNQRGNYNQQGQGQNQGQGHYTKGDNYGQDYGPGYRQPYQGQRIQQQQVDNNQEETDGPMEASQRQARSPFKSHGQSVRGELRTDRETDQLQKDLKVLFPEESQNETIKKVLSNHARETDLTRLANYCMSVLDETLS